MKRYETTLRRLPILAGLLFIVSVPILATLLSKELGWPALLDRWGAGFLSAWTIALVGLVHCAVFVVRSRIRLERLARQTGV